MAITRRAERERNRLLTNEAREHVYRTIEAEPGLSLTELADAAPVSMSTVRHHVARLEEADLVASEKRRGRRCYYLAEPSRVDPRVALRNDAVRPLLAALYEDGPASVTALSESVGLDPSTTSYHLQWLAEEDVVERRRVGRRVESDLLPGVREALAVYFETE